MQTFFQIADCRFSNDCSYRHVKDSEKDMKVNKDTVDLNTEYIKTITEEINNQIKV